MSYQHSIVVELVNLIEMNIQHDLSIEKLSDLSGYSKWHLQRMFQRYTGMKIATYIRNRRLSKSAVMLKQSDLKVLEVATAIGFSSQQAFSRAFQRFFGESPKDFRTSQEWDFSKHLPPFLIQNPSAYHFIEMPKNIYLLKGYKFFLYHSMNASSSGGEERQKYGSRTGKNTDTLMRTVKLASSGWEVTLSKGYYETRNLTLIRGQYLLIEFNGRLNEYLVFFDSIYDAYLPLLGVRIRNGFLIELHKEKNFQYAEINVKVLIYIGKS
ncbi:helix-turn-helix domain-containing protein [Serratia nevei]|uniref:helix-turn-helix domain-containing protein n=1 Tax=Serratia nevei TaxID=2703794 RepID=UPI003F7EB6D9